MRELFGLHEAADFAVDFTVTVPERLLPGAKGALKLEGIGAYGM